MWRAVILLAASVAVTSANDCVSRRSEARGDDDGHYCVCNATYCDTVPDAIKPTNPAQYVLITSSKSGLRFHVSNGEYGNVESSDDSLGKITVNRTDQYQSVIGFGGALTDAAGINIKSLSKDAADNLLRSYFGKDGIEYSIIRTPMGASDFSLRPYSYALLENDTTLSGFSLQTEDYSYKIPIIKRAKQLSEREIKLLTAPWSASPWMKNNSDWEHHGSLLPEYRQLWAEYFLKYFQHYRRLGLEFWGVSSQNEPYNYLYIEIGFIGMAWTAEEERDWIIDHLSPTLRKAGFENIKILVGEDNRPMLPELPKAIFQDEKAKDLVFATAVHWYYDNITNPDILDEVKQLFPNKPLMYTEACTGVQMTELDKTQHVVLGSWDRGQQYAKNIIQNLSHWVSSWVDWNIALNLIGGPNWVKNYVDAPIIVNATADEFYKQPMYYVLGHFTKYVPPDSVRIGTTAEKTEGIENVAFSTPDDGTVLVILNLNEEEKDILIEDPEKGTTRINIPGKSINTMKYW